MKKITRLSSLTLAAAMLLGGIPYHAYASEELLQHDLEKVNQITKAEAAFAEGTVTISPQLNTKSSKNVSVIVQLASEPGIVAKHAGKKASSMSAKELERKVEKEQDAFLKKAKSENIKLKVGRKFSHVLNAVEVTLPADKIEELAKLPNVKAIYENTQYSAPEVEAERLDDSTDKPKYDIGPLKQIGVLDMWEKGLTGKGLKVGVIDTGVDYLHPDLADAYKGGYDSYDKDSDPYEEPPIPVEEDPEGTGYEGSAHGTHVSGTIAGRATNPTSDIQVKGVAYEADLYVYRVLGRHGGSTAQVIDGIERAVQDGMDVINLSLGSAMEKNADSPDAIAVNNAMLAGVVTVVSSGNSADDEVGRYYYTAGSPSGAKLPITVGAVDSPSVLYDGSAQSSFGENYDFHVMAYQINKDNFAELLGTDPLPVVYANLGSESDFAKVDVNGKVALVSRGTLAFDAKIANARKAGAKAIVIFNGNDANGDGQADLDLPDRAGYIGTVLGDQLEAIPTFDMIGVQGRELAKQLLADPEKASTLTFSFSSDYPATQSAGDRMAGFSSRGPVLGEEYSIKPNVTAPGVSVLSSVAAWGKELDDANYNLAYARYNGTSMSAPHVTGLSLLLKQAHPDWTPFDVKAALSNTAKRIKDEEGTPYDVYSQGAGRVDGAAAAETPALLQTVEQITILDENLEPKTITYNGENLSFGLVRAGSKEITKTLQLKNTGDEDVAYEAEVIMHDEVTSDPYNPQPTPNVDNIKVSLSTDEVRAEGNDTETFTLSLSSDRRTKVGVYEGEVLLKSKDGHPDLHLPFAVHIGDRPEENNFGFANIRLSDTTISPNGDGKEDDFNLEALLQVTDVNAIEVQAWSYDDTYIGTMASLFHNYAPIPRGPIKFSKLDGTYYDGTEEAKQLGNGKYKLRLVGALIDPSKPEGQQLVKTYEAWKAFAIKDLDQEGQAPASAKQLVQQAAESFKADVINTSKLDEQVLTLPKDVEGLSFQVTKSSDESFISDEGILTAIPNQKKATVTLTVTITSTEDESIKETVKVKVTIEPQAEEPEDANEEAVEDKAVNTPETT